MKDKLINILVAIFSTIIVLILLALAFAVFSLLLMAIGKIWGR